MSTLSAPVLLAVAAGGAAGAVARYVIAGAVAARAGAPAIGTISVNVIGSLLMGIAWGMLVMRGPADAVWRAGLLAGLLGGFTTFSAFSLDALALLQAGQGARAVLYVLASVAMCLIAVWAGVEISRQL